MEAERHPAERSVAIRQWTERLQELVDATGLSFRQLAKRVHCAPATLTRYVHGERVVDSAWRLVPTLIDLGKKNGGTVSVDVDELHSIFSLAKHEYQEQQAGRGGRSQVLTGSSAANDDGGGSSRLPKWKVLVGVLVGLGLGGLAVGGVVVFNSAADPAPAQDTRVWQAKIVGTWSVPLQQYLGVHKYRSPDVPGDTDNSTLHEGTIVAVVCQARERRLVRDPSTGRTSAVWNKLDDGYWVPDMYTDLAKVSGPTPPLDIPVCD